MEEKEIKKEPSKEHAPKKINVPTQKTFKFKASASETEIDAVINKWLKQLAFSGQAAFLGKVTSSGFLFPKIVYVFMYSTQVEQKKL